GVLAAGRTVDQQNGGSVAVRMAALRIGDRRTSCQPVDRKTIVRIGKFVARLARTRRFATVLVGVPRDGGWQNRASPGTSASLIPAHRLPRRIPPASSIALDGLAGRLRRANDRARQTHDRSAPSCPSR